MEKAPVALFVYNRKEKTKQTLNALNKNYGVEETNLFIFCDGPKDENAVNKVKEVRLYLHKEFVSESKFKSVKIIESDKNKGLANSIISGVTEVINQYGKAIIVEDDLLTTRDFLNYMNGGLDYYQDKSCIGSISGYMYPLNYLKKYKKDICILRKGECWGWATWKDRWSQVDWNVSDFDNYYNDLKKRKQFDSIGAGLDNMLCAQVSGKIDSWAVRWCYHLFCNKLLTVYPRVSRTYNIGVDGSGTHCEETDKFNTSFDDNISFACKFEMQKVNHKVEKEINKFDSNAQPFAVLIKNRLVRMWNNCFNSNR